MPKRSDIKKILIIGSGPIVIGQAAEFDYSGTQACRALKEEGYSVVLVNSNPATIMTDPSVADRTYIEPLTVEVLEEIIKAERPDALLPTLGGQTALNLAVKLYEEGILERYGVELIGASYQAIKKGEDRELFRESMKKIGLKVPESAVVSSLEEGMSVIKSIGFPTILRPAFTLGGTGGAIAYNIEEFKEKLEVALKTSPIHQVLMDKSLIGWKEFEFEVIRDSKDNVIIVCSIENFDPMGVHTGDSITVAPAQTLTDKEYQILRDACIEVMREVGVDTGGSNIQFAVNPENGDFYVIEMNPRVSRSSALASKATGFPIAKVAAKLAVGYTLDELRNDITKHTPASFEPSIDYVVVKIPRFDFAKFPQTDRTLTTMMKSVGEVMAIGRTFKEAFLKAIRSLEIDTYGLLHPSFDHVSDDVLVRNLRIPNPERIWYIASAFRRGYSVDEVYHYTKVDRWFLYQIKQIVDFESTLAQGVLDEEKLRQAKELGYSDFEIAKLVGKREEEVRALRESLRVLPAFKGVDTCAGEFVAYTPYYYSTYEKPYYTMDGQEILDQD
ncbi:Carbamoyl-phosphate synthase L chain ATP-binding protein [Hydrogenobacter thermophilus TK-6]|uniref:Carbamoyl-phosphate synthase large subunit n=1 Tax=Hydrogenobacter thermophilus (strain DSM 6534 / IAM 12695 / TK-6) TaxID=608538 RepID=D3DIQ4_HYDTT|nr:carbamoyl-phosphate synthase large subunit [Hydrogenobacter thermophilus]ADO45632.1 Carbamoyl-phosphate synthase L chain ATP-binding protein [Hydrogenobacter thermophilus TK-6]BAI69706.1 carbamoyl-phosphate synthase large subunit [Hydrogenobacter thermophilus TK-6]